MYIKIIIIRHGKTKGNEKKQYIGKTNENLSEIGKKEVAKIVPFVNEPQMVFSSPMKRCIETKTMIFPNLCTKIIPEISEIDFGEFEKKTYEQLKDTKSYIQWLRSGGKSTIHHGESVNQFKIRCKKGFLDIVKICKENKLNEIAIIAHGGTIMAILDLFSVPNKSFYHWQVENANGYKFLFDTEKERALNIEKWKL
ncbi:MAG: histidine phosphatase family protein [Lachnospiraceae bacterium]